MLAKSYPVGSAAGLLISKRERSEMEFSKEKQYVFPFAPKDRQFCEKRRKFLKEFSISPDYHLAILKYIDENFGLKGKRILELGGSNIPREILLDDFGVKQYVGVDYIESWWPDPNHKREKVYLLEEFDKVFDREDPYQLYSGSVNDLKIDTISGYFDVIVSFSSIEHFSNTPLMLEKASDALKKGGVYIASSEPLWSSGKGHHFWIDGGYNFQVTNDFDFAHLLYDKSEFLKKFEAKKDVQDISRQIYDWSGINRTFYKEIEEAVYASKFSGKVIFPFILQAPPANIIAELHRRHGSKVKNDQDFSIRGIQWILEK
jgi:SAM-dependent methyltransferase